MQVLVCPSCHASLTGIDDTQEKWNCEYCGNTIMNRKLKTSNIHHLKDLADDHYKFHRYEEAFAYYNKVLESDANQYGAILRKALCACWTTPYQDVNLEELQYYFEKACKLCRSQNNLEQTESFVIISAHDLYLFIKVYYRYLTKDDNLQLNGYLNLLRLSSCVIGTLQEFREKYDSPALQGAVERLAILIFQSCKDVLDLDGDVLSDVYLSDQLLAMLASEKYACEQVLATLPGHTAFSQHEENQQQKAVQFWQTHPEKRQIIEKKLLELERTMQRRKGAYRLSLRLVIPAFIVEILCIGWFFTNEETVLPALALLVVSMLCLLLVWMIVRNGHRGIDEPQENEYRAYLENPFQYQEEIAQM